MKVKLIVEGGKMQPGPAVSQQLGPMGINLGKVISDVNEATKGYVGLKVPVELDVDPKSKDFSVSVFSPPVSELIKKELNLERGSGKPNEIKVGNIAIERIISIADTKSPDLLAKDLKAAVKLVVGTCVSLGALVDNKEPKEIEIEIDNGKYDKEINEKITNVSDDKKSKLEKFFAVRKAKQEKDIKAAEEAAKAEEDAKDAAAKLKEGEKKEAAEGGEEKKDVEKKAEAAEGEKKEKKK
jgi:large subunit ribosomal protein L11